MRQQKTVSPGEAFDHLRLALAVMTGLPEESGEVTAMALAVQEAAMPMSELVQHGYGHLKIYIAKHRYESAAMAKTYKPGG